MKTLCIYHGNCADGFGAATVIRIALGSHQVDFHAGVHQDPPPDVTDREVILVDFSYKRDVLIEMAGKAKSILILDHHKSAQADLVDLPDNVTAHFDMSKSGAVMAWEHFQPDEKIPQLLLHIQDRDLWKFELEGTREIQACVFSFPYEFERWEQLLSADLQKLREEGAAIERKHFKDIHEFIGAAAHRMTIAGHDVPVLNAPYFWSSDAGHIMGEGEPFAACYWDTPDGRVFSLRSADDGLDVSEIAKQFGGGGHAHAAGFRVSMREAVEMMFGGDSQKGAFEAIDKWKDLYVSINKMMAALGAAGEITTRANEVHAVMDALHDLDDGDHGSLIEKVTDLERDSERYNMMIMLTRLEIGEMTQPQREVWVRIMKGGWYEDDLINMLDKLIDA